MSLVREFVQDCSSVNSDFFPLDKSIALLRDFSSKRDLITKSGGKESEPFSNMKLLEEEFRIAFHAIESPFLVSNCVSKVFQAYRFAPEFSMLTVKGLFFGLKLYLADLEADDEVIRFYKEKLIKRFRELDFEILLLVGDYFHLVDERTTELLIDVINKTIRELKNDTKQKRTAKAVMSLVHRYNFYEAVDWEFLVKSAVAQEMFDEAFHFAKPCKNASVLLLSLMVPSKNSKHMKLLIKAHNLDVDAFPQLFEYMRYGYFRFVVRESGYDLIEERAALNSNDLPSLIRFLLLSKMRNEAFSVYERHKERMDLSAFKDDFANKSQYTYLEHEARVRDDFRPTTVLKNPSLSKEYYSMADLGLDEDHVTVVTRANFDDAREAINASSLVGIDSEFFTRDCSGYYNHELGLIQIATPTSVYLFDCCEIGPSFKLSYFIHSLLKNDKICKVSLGFDSDLKVFGEFFKIQSAYEVNNIVNLETLEGGTAKVGLATLCEKHLLRKLCKAEQISAWNQRPLRRAQIHYAALDAAILLRLFNVMRQKGSILFTPEKLREGKFGTPVKPPPTPPDFENDG